MTLPVLRLHPADPIGIALADLAPGDAIGPTLVALDAIPRGHKVALLPLEAGAPVTKFDTFIGVASGPIAAGAHVHSHNLAFRPSRVDRGMPSARRNSLEPLAGASGATFQGYRRDDGRVGTRNVLLVLATVNCSATVAKRIAEQFRREVDLSATPSIDGVVALTHQHGCSFRADGPGMAILRRTLGGYARHPNVAGTLVVGLGCEDNQVDEFLAAAGLATSERLATRVIQQEGGTTATVAAGVAALKAMLPRAAAVVRTTASASHLTVGLQCGGSDGFSAISANPALGLAVDRLVNDGGTAILSETPEIYGAEQLLLERAANEPVADRLRALLAWWEANAHRDDGTLDNNPSPGNKQGGITTILEKSLGAVSKAGSSPLNAVYDYAEPITASGLVFMDSPGYDPVSATGQVAAGANLICFTTGRGSCFGCAPVPSLKIATNSGLFRRMAGDMDLDAGPILDGTTSHAMMGDAIFARILATASGERTASEQLGYGEEEFVPWAQGLTY
ncbi:UxaA family hydrolase [Lichenifustis flavocetrariae]|uniref:Altronate dehydratase family protein n=1 Tax=Lichenifustis flavocetrariae TaxID=2949735 RepID=A0AA41YW72_9HYPH|nr:altronate dehydratase family protein [Lichenifustis flavocetrariae]MCW6509249.1 altronate dehydratase family protein [Lichenifustis flavocetrariae]